MNTRIFTWKTLCPTKVKNHDLPPVGFSTLHYHGQIGYKVTHTLCAPPMDTTPHVLVSPRLGQITYSQKNEFFSLLQRFLLKQIVRNNESTNILPRPDLNHSQSTRFSFFQSSHTFLQCENLFFQSRALPPKTKYFCFLNKIEQNRF